jgi:hypothetical protein
MAFGAEKQSIIEYMDDETFWVHELATEPEPRNVGGFGVYLSWAVLAIVAIVSLGVMIARLI